MLSKSCDTGKERMVLHSYEPPLQGCDVVVKATPCASNMISMSNRRKGAEKLPGAKKWRKAFPRPLSTLLNDLISNCQRVNILKDLAHYSGSKLCI